MQFSTKSIVVGGLLGITALGLLWQLSEQHAAPSVAYAQQAAVADQAKSGLVASADNLSQGFRNVAKAVRPSVVSINVSVKPSQPQTRGRRSPLPPEFEQFFGGGLFDDFEFQMPERRQEGMGSGVIVSADGYIVTNNHVVRGADEVQVKLSDNRIFEAKVVGTDEKGDIAILKIDASGLVAAPLGDSSALEVGDWVIAIGSPFGLAQTVTAGIISAMNRDEHITEYDDLIQTDAAINPGNSGGPLLNMRGEVIGINTAIASRSGSYDGIGFAIPSNIVNNTFQNIVKHGRVLRGFIGTRIEDLTPEAAAQLGLDSATTGAYVALVAEGGPAQKAGLQAGDVVVAVDGKPIEGSSQLRKTIAMYAPDSKVKFEILRKGQPKTLTVQIEEQTDEKLAAMSGGRVIEKLGVEIDVVPSARAKQSGLTREDGGVIVTRVDPSGALGELLVEGDIILSVNDQAVRNPTDFVKAAGMSEDMIKIVVRRGRSTLTATLALPRN
jgi:serine protease Do